LAGVVVVPDRGGKCEYSLVDAHSNAGDGVPAVPFKAELIFERVEDRLDGLTQRLEEPGPGRARSPARAGRSSSAPDSLSRVSNMRPK
jgi:hypothetical protein